MVESSEEEYAVSLADRLQQDFPGLLESYPIEACAGAFDALPAAASYDTVPAAVESLAARITATRGEGALRLYNQLLLVELIRGAAHRSRELGMPESVEGPTLDFLRRTLAALEQGRGGTFALSSDRFLKDLSVARLKLLVCGPELVDLSGGIPRRVLMERPIVTIPSRAAFLLGRVRGLAPLLESHLDRRLAREFTPEGYEAMYLRLADLLLAFPSVRGFVGAGAWFCDPAVSALSPELRFVTDLPRAHGARLIPAETSEASVRDAIRTSPVRRAAYEAGEYSPRSYMLVWARQDLLNWARTAGSRAG